MLLAGGGTFLVFLFFHWLFIEPKHFGLRGEQYIQTKGVWFYAVVSILLAVLVWFALQENPLMAFGAVIGSTAFFIVHGFRQNAEAQEAKLQDRGLSDVSKIFYLEVIDATFSIDGVLGASLHPVGTPDTRGERHRGLRGPGDDHGEHRADQALPLPEERGHVLDPLPGRDHAGGLLRDPHPSLAVSRGDHRYRRVFPL